MTPKNRNAFTMLELIFVIIVMAILAKFGFDFLARSYDSFIFSKINNDLLAKSESATELIAKRLETRIKQSARAYNPTTGVSNLLIGGDTDENATILEWIGAAEESFRGIKGV